MNGFYEKAKILAKTEEQYETQLPARIPGIGRAFRASEVAFEDSALRARTSLFDLFEKQAKEHGVDTASKEYLESSGKLINSMTARGDLGRLGKGGLIKLVMWAPKMLKGNIDVLTAHGLGAGLDSPWVRKQALGNLAKIVGTTGGILAVANAIKPGSVEIDPRSSDFGKIRIGNTRFDVSGGKGSIVTLLSRLVTMSSKSSTSGNITSLNSDKYGSKSFFDVGLDFLVNKTPPLTRLGIDVARGKNFQGQKVTPANALMSIFTPISIQNFVQQYYGPDKDGSVAALVGNFLDFVGINANTYSPNVGKSKSSYRPTVY
jgi:hypothetical protein